MFYNKDRSEILQQCFAEFRSGRITQKTARAVRDQALRSLGVQNDGWKAVEKALTIAFTVQRPKRKK